MEQPGILQHHGIRKAQAFAGYAINIAPVNRDRPAVSIVKAHQQVDDCRFSRACGADNRRHRAAWRIQVQVGKNDLARFIPKAHVFERNIAFHLLQLLRPLCVRRLRRLVKQAEHAFGRRKCALHLRKKVCELVDRPGKLARIQHKGRNIAEGDRPAHVKQRAEHADERKRKVVHEVHRGPHHTSIIIRIAIGVNRFLVLHIKPVDHHLFAVISFCGALAARDLFHKAVEFAELFGAQAEQRPYFFRPIACNEHRNRDRHNEHEDQHGRD